MSTSEGSRYRVIGICWIIVSVLQLPWMLVVSSVIFNDRIYLYGSELIKARGYWIVFFPFGPIVHALMVVSSVAVLNLKPWGRRLAIATNALFAIALVFVCIPAIPRWHLLGSILPVGLLAFSIESIMVLSSPALKAEFQSEVSPPGSIKWKAAGLSVLSILALGSMLQLGFFASGASSNQRTFPATLKTLPAAEEDFRVNDRDGNGIQDYWTGDVAGLYCLVPVGTPQSHANAIKLLEPSLAQADFAPHMDIASLTSGGKPIRKSGYYVVAMKRDLSTQPPSPYQVNTGGPSDMGPVHNLQRYAFCAFSNSTATDFKWTYIINQEGHIWKRDLGGQPVYDWPADPKADGWVPAD